VATVTVIDTDSSISFASATNSINETGNQRGDQLVRAGSSVGAVTVNFATAMERQPPASGTLPPTAHSPSADGQVTNSIVVSIINDALVEGARRLT